MTPIQFGTDGWRGVIADDVTFDQVKRVAGAFASVLWAGSDGRRPVVVVGFDRRFASDAFARAAADTLANHGLDVLFSREPISTPIISHAVVNSGATGGFVVTASHNTPIFNGVKLKSPKGSSAPRSLLRAVETESQSVEFGRPGVERGQVREIDPLHDYLDRLGRLVSLDRLRGAGLTVVADPMFGTAAGILPRVLAGDATQVVEINTAHNPLFPGIAGPEPVERNLSRLKKVVADGGAHIGIAFDGDGDRIGVVDERGEYVSAQHVFGLLGQYVYTCRGLKGPIVKSVTGTAMIDILGEQNSVPVIETATGFTSISEAMIDESAALGGEESGGFAFGIHLPERDGLLACLFLLDFMLQVSTPLSQLVAELEDAVGRWRYRRIDLPLASEVRNSFQNRLHGLEWPVSMAELHVQRVVPMDGTRIEFEDGSWLLVRPSGTEPLLRLYAEAHDSDTVDQLLAAAREFLKV